MKIQIEKKRLEFFLMIFKSQKIQLEDIKNY